MTYFLLAFSVLVPAVGQLLFKAIALRGPFETAVLGDIRGMALFAGTVLLYGLSTISWVFVLRRMPLSSTYPLFALGFVLVPIAAHFLFGERISTGLIAGTALIVAGIAIIHWEF